MNRFNLQTHLNYRTDRALSAARVMPYGVSFLDDAFCGISPADLVLIGARTGCGKTQLATQIALNASRMGKRVQFFALEADKHEIEDRLLYSATARVFFSLPPSERPNIWLRYRNWRLGEFDQELSAIEEKVYQQLALDTSELHQVYRDKQFTVDDFVKTLEEGIFCDPDLIVIDHLHYFDFHDCTEMEGLKRAVRLIRSVALDHEKPIILLAQLRKTDRKVDGEIPDIDDFYGHSDVVKIATDVILLAKATDFQSKPGTQATYAYIAKSRHAGDAQGYAGVLSYSLETSSYQSGYYLSRVKRFSPPEIIKTKKDMPRWAKNALEQIF